MGKWMELENSVLGEEPKAIYQYISLSYADPSF